MDPTKIVKQATNNKNQTKIVAKNQSNSRTKLKIKVNIMTSN